MSYGKQQQQSVSKPLIIALIVVAIIAAIMFARNMSGATEEKVTGIPPVPEGLPPATRNPGEPAPVDMGSR